MLKCWLTIDKNGIEHIWQFKPIKEADYWTASTGQYMPLPYGSIEKVTGVKLDWEIAMFYEQNLK